MGKPDEEDSRSEVGLPSRNNQSGEVELRVDDALWYHGLLFYFYCRDIVDPETISQLERLSHGSVFE